MMLIEKPFLSEIFSAKPTYFWIFVHVQYGETVPNMPSEEHAWRAEQEPGQEKQWRSQRPCRRKEGSFVR